MFQSLQEFTNVLDDLPTPDQAAARAAMDRQNQLTKPPGSLGRLEEIAIFMAGWQGVSVPNIKTIQGILFAGNHGVCAQNISPYPPTVTRQMVANFENGGAAINALTTAYGHELTICPLSLDEQTGDITVGPALDEQELLACLNKGAEAVLKSKADLIYYGEMGIGNSTIAAALCAASFSGDGQTWAGRGTGADDQLLKNKIRVIDQALKTHNKVIEAGEPLQILRHLGGREQAAITGGVVAARIKRIPVMLDGFIVCASIAPLVKVVPDLTDHLLAGHVSHEQGHKSLLAAFGLTPLLDLNMRLGEGTGAAMACALVKGALAAHENMATFDQAGVSDRDV